MANSSLSNINIPRHVAIVMDGNGRWAKSRMMPRLFGHQRGVEAARTAIKACSKAGVECLTLFAFSSENWKRPEEEVSGLMKLFMKALEREAEGLVRHNVRLQFIGDKSAFSDVLQVKIKEVEQMTSSSTGMTLLIAANYGGRWDIVHAMNQWLAQANEKQLQQGLTEAALAPYFSTAHVSEPDLFIRTGGEQRISNFLIWQMAYAEFYFSERLWPEFSEEDLYTAFADFSRRQRRFGMTGEQVKGSEDA